MIYISNIILPLITLIIIIYALYKKVNIYDVFVEGSKESYNMVLTMFPCMLAMIFGINIFIKSGILEYIFSFFQNGLDMINLPVQIIPMAIMRPISGSSSLAILNTILCLLIGYPVAFFLADRKINKSAILVTLFIMPMWINFVIRTGATRDLLSWLDISGAKRPQLATLIGLVYNYLPFTILPLYTTMLKMDRSQIEASKDLGANGFQTFTRVIIPLTMPGIVSAATMVFMPTMSSYVISDILSEYKVVLFGAYIDLYFNQNDWNFGSFMALIMLILIFISVFISRKFSNDDSEGKESIW